MGPVYFGPDRLSSKPMAQPNYSDRRHKHLTTPYRLVRIIDLSGQSTDDE